MVFVRGRISNYELDGNNDWYMPFKDELNLVYLNLHGIFGGGGTKWSSSEVDINSVWVQDFITREQYKTERKWGPTFTIGISEF